MTTDKIKMLIMSKIEKINMEIRSLESTCKKFSVEPESNSAYIGMVGYRAALRDLHEEIRSFDDSSKSFYKATE
jgi:hypothetical protein